MPNRPTLARLLLAFLALALPASLPAQNAYFFPDAGEFDERIPTPAEFLGYDIGTHYTRHDQLVAYFQELARVSDAVSVREIGRSYEQRPLIVATITAPGNHARLDAIQRERARLTDPEAPPPGADAPVVVLLGYSVHGNETSSGEAALLTAYYLAAHRGEETRRFLERAVVLIDPAQNPDGRDRSATWHNAYGSNPPVADPADLDHQQPFPGGRTNHYFTDLNRDWLAITQRETGPKIDVFHAWYPHVHIDFHEMGTGSTYYFEPSPASLHSPLIPQASYDFNLTLARYHAAGLDALGSLYYTGEDYDNFSPVYGSTYPDFHGAVGVTVEQASSRGLAQETASGVLTFPFTIRNQVATGLATVRGAVAERDGLFALQRDFYRSALEQARRHPARAYVFGDPADPALTRRLLELLLRHRIEVHELAGRTTVDGVDFEPGSAYVVPAAQPQFRLVHSIFEKTPPVEGEVFYGSTSYSIVHAYNLRHAASRRAPATGARVHQVPAAAGGVSGGRAGHAYLLDWRDYNAARALVRLLDAEVRVRAAFQPFTAGVAEGAREFGHGSLVVPVAGQDLDAQALHALLQETGEAAGVRFHAVDTGLNLAGVDLGSNNVRPVRKPSVALVMGQGVQPTQIGSAWFLLEEHLRLPATRLDPARLADTPLDRYTSIVLAGGSYGDWPEDRIEALKAWVRAGGSLVTFGTASEWAIGQGLAEARLREPDEESGDDADGGDRLDFGSQRDVTAIERISGNAVSADADPSHPIAFGVPQRALFVNKEGATVLEPSHDRFSTPVRIDDAPRVNGYLSERNRARIGGSAYVVVAQAGRGNVILFADDPAHRKYWHGTERLLFNSLFFADQTVPGRRR